MSGSSQISIAPQLLQAAADRVVQRCDQLAECSDHPGKLTRTFCSPAMKQSHERLTGWMQAAEMECDLDSVGNLIGRSRSTGKGVVMIGSHVDTVVDAGRFDGSLGILLGLAAAEVIREANIDLGFGLDVVAFSEEEGVRYRYPFIGSLGIAGTFDRNDFELTDEDGVSMGEALRNLGCNPDQLNSASYQDRDLIGFMETHMEQAVLLEEADLPVGVVSAIAGQTRATIVIEGQAGHAGTVPHDRRRDALAAAADLILKIENLGQTTPGLFATVGSVVAAPGLSNVISGRAELRLDLRHENDATREAAFESVQKLISEVSDSRGVTPAMTAVQHSPAVLMDAGWSDHLQSTVAELGLSPNTMVSGAGHDAMIMSNIAPSCMLFVRCRDGVSHHPDEFVSPDDILVALRVMVGALIKFAQSRATA